MTIQCESPASPGRVRCAAELRPREGQRILWADILAVRSSGHTRPLRSRVRATLSQDGAARATLALLAKGSGRFELVLRGRAVVCIGREQGAGCRPAVQEATAALRVGD